MNEYTIQDIQIGMRAEFEKTITVEMEDAFRQISGDVNPLHYDDEYANEVGGGRFSSHVTFGMLTASLYSTLAGVYLPGKYSLIHSLEDLKFLKPVYKRIFLMISSFISFLAFLFIISNSSSFLGSVNSSPLIIVGFLAILDLVITSVII